MFFSEQPAVGDPEEERVCDPARRTRDRDVNLLIVAMVLILDDQPSGVPAGMTPQRGQSSLMSTVRRLGTVSQMGRRPSRILTRRASEGSAARTQAYGTRNPRWRVGLL